jgi:hypothetical protein
MDPLPDVLFPWMSFLILPQYYIKKALVKKWGKAGSISSTLLEHSTASRDHSP